MAIILQASLLCKPSLSLTPPHQSSPLKRHRFHHCLSPPRHHHRLHFLSLRFRPITRALHPDNVDSEDSKLVNSSNPDFVKRSDLPGGVLESGIQESGTAEVSKSEVKVEEVNGGGSLGKSVAADEKLAEKEGAKSKLSLLVFFMGVWARLRRGMEKLMTWDWLSWWPFWRQEKRLEQLIAEANANPKDAAKQSALLAELNKHRLLYGILLKRLILLMFIC